MDQRSASPVSTQQQRDEDASIRETLEAILVAFILAFIVRAFMVEAFVIPTGSMAPTLMGAHMRVQCPDCAYAFEVNYSPSGREDSWGRSPDTHEFRCPNCGDRFREQPLIYSGDRILVLKYTYLFHQPQRWDVVVFKSPELKLPGEPHYNPHVGPYEENFIKRLVGTPGESVMILDGDVYVGTRDTPLGEFQIQTKPHHIQQALWRILYDSDYEPRGRSGRSIALGPWRHPWRARDGDGWLLGGRAFHFDRPGGHGSLYYDSTANHVYSFTDWLPYNTVGAGNASGHRVSDLLLEFFYQRHRGDGPLRVALTKDGDRFVAEVHPDRAVVLHQQGGEENIIGEAPLPRRGDPLHVAFSNYDYRVSLRINNRELIATTPRQYRPDVARLLEDFAQRRARPLPSVELAAADQTCTLTHVRLWRDIYYLNDGERTDNVHFAGSPGNVMHLGEDELFVLGDNSMISGDSRHWFRPIDLPHEDLYAEPGRVPTRFLIGKAFFVYWPTGFRPFPRAPPLIPNFGEMRFIR